VGIVAYRVLVWGPEVKRPFGRLMHRREDNFNVVFKKQGRGAWEKGGVLL
jgi:hypothetical protein